VVEEAVAEGQVLDGSLVRSLDVAAVVVAAAASQ